MPNYKNVLVRSDDFSPGRISAWTDLISHVRPTVAKGKRPCSYAPWSDAIKNFVRDLPGFQDLYSEIEWLPTDLINFAGGIAQPRWDEPRRDLIEFALVYLEADVMLFRSGYTKRHLIKRLQQSPLTEPDITRIERLLRRVVTDGAGREEFEAYRKLAAHLAAQGHLAGFCAWLEDRADGAILTIDKASGVLCGEVLKSDGLSEDDTSRWINTSLIMGAKWGVTYPDFSTLVPARPYISKNSQKMRRNAYWMISAIKRRLQSRKKK